MLWAIVHEIDINYIIVFGNFVWLKSSGLAATRLIRKNPFNLITSMRIWVCREYYESTHSHKSHAPIWHKSTKNFDMWTSNEMSLESRRTARVVVFAKNVFGTRLTFELFNKSLVPARSFMVVVYQFNCFAGSHFTKKFDGWSATVILLFLFSPAYSNHAQKVSSAAAAVTSCTRPIKKTHRVYCWKWTYFGLAEKLWCIK